MRERLIMAKGSRKREVMVLQAKAFDRRRAVNLLSDWAPLQQKGGK